MDAKRLDFVRSTINNCINDDELPSGERYGWKVAHELLTALDDKEMRFLRVLSDEAKRQEEFETRARAGGDNEDGELFMHAKQVLRNLSYKIAHQEIEL